MCLLWSGMATFQHRHANWRPVFVKRDIVRLAVLLELPAAYMQQTVASALALMHCAWCYKDSRTQTDCATWKLSLEDRHQLCLCSSTKLLIYYGTTTDNARPVSTCIDLPSTATAISLVDIAQAPGKYQVAEEIIQWGRCNLHGELRPTNCSRNNSQHRKLASQNLHNFDRMDVC